MSEDGINESEAEAFESAYLGRGWSFPVRWSTVTGRDGEPDQVAVQMTARVADIFESIQIILETVLGERVMRPEFGSMTNRFLFASISTQTKTGLASVVRKALLLWERRIRDIQVQVTENQEHTSRLDVEISFYVDTHRMRHSRIFPFYVHQPWGDS